MRVKSSVLGRKIYLISSYTSTIYYLTFKLYISQHAVAFVNGDQYYGAKASINVWAPLVTDEYEFSLSQLWVISGSFGNDLNTIEAGWQVYTHTHTLKSCNINVIEHE